MKRLDVESAQGEKVYRSKMKKGRIEDHLHLFSSSTCERIWRSTLPAVPLSLQKGICPQHLWGNLNDESIIKRDNGIAPWVHGDCWNIVMEPDANMSLAILKEPNVIIMSCWGGPCMPPQGLLCHFRPTSEVCWGFLLTAESLQKRDTDAQWNTIEYHPVILWMSWSTLKTCRVDLMTFLSPTLWIPFEKHF